MQFVNVTSGWYRHIHTHAHSPHMSDVCKTDESKFVYNPYCGDAQPEYKLHTSRFSKILAHTMKNWAFSSKISVAVNLGLFFTALLSLLFPIFRIVEQCVVWIVIIMATMVQKMQWDKIQMT